MLKLLKSLASTNFATRAREGAVIIKWKWALVITIWRKEMEAGVGFEPASTALQAAA